MGRGIALTMIVGMAIGFGWYKLWVEPNDQYRKKIMECMNSEEISIMLPSRSKEAYDECVVRLKDKR